MANGSDLGPAPGGAYFAGNADAAQELARLHFLENLYDPRCQQALVAAGLAPGMRVLEIGPGAGSMLGWLSDQIGPGGHVTALDRDPRFLTGFTRPNATVITGDIRDIALTDPFDLVFMRFVLMHLPEPVKTLREIANLLRPDGALVAVDLDMCTHIAAAPWHPGAALFDRRRAALVDALVAGEVMNLNFARQLGPLIGAAGLRLEALSYETHLVEGGSDAALQWRRGSEHTVRALDATGQADPGAADFLPLHDDPDFAFLAPLVGTAIARRCDSPG
ncbi:MAG: methyltransferase domain-containing protein [Pseudomonadota bacterium]